MLVIHKAQCKVLNVDLRRSFYNRMETHIKKYFPDHASALNQGQTLSLFDYGIEQGKKYGFISERNVCLYIDLMLAFGLDFDASEAHPWATGVLTDPSQNHPDIKMDVLHERGMNSLKAKF